MMARIFQFKNILIYPFDQEQNRQQPGWWDWVLSEEDNKVHRIILFAAIWILVVLNFRSGSVWPETWHNLIRFHSETGCTRTNSWINLEGNGALFVSCSQENVILQIHHHQSFSLSVWLDLWILPFRTWF